MLTEVIMPKAGSEMEEGQIVKWLKKEGDKVEAGEIILEIMTDKVNMEIEAETSGTLLKILKHDGEIVPVITTIAYIGDEGDVIPETASAPAKEEIKEEVKAQVEEKVVEVKAETKKELKDGEYDVVVIGGGPAGYYSAIKAAQKGAKVAIAENNKFGGTCLNRGCIPTKTYLQNVEDIERIKASSKRGIILENDKATVDVSKALKFKNSIVKKLTAGVEFLLKSNSVEMFKETAYINSNGNVTLESGKELVCGSIIFAGGSKCVKNIKGSENSNVIDRKETAIEVIDSEVSSILIKSLEKSGIKFIFGKEITEISGEKVLAGSEEVASAKVILLTTREADLTALKDVKLEVSNGNVVANDKMQSSLKNVYVPGDVNGKNLLAHAAFKMGDIVASEIVEGKSDKYNNNIIPRAIYTYPEIGSVGLTEEEAKKSYDVKVGKFNYGANGRALAHGDSSGMVKIISDARYGEILGAHIVGPRASELINEVSVLMQSEVIVEEAIKMVFGHPTFSEAIYEAIADVEGVSVHLPKK